MVLYPRPASCSLINQSLASDSSLILVPSFMFGESNPTAFPQYLLKHIPEETMSELVLHNLQHRELRDEIAFAHLNYCTEHKLYGAKDFALEFLRRDESEGYRYSAVHYISELYGERVIIDEVVPLRDDESFLRDIAYHIPLRLSAPLFDEKLDAILSQNPSSGLLELMIRRNHRKALEMYYAEAARIKTLPDMTIGSRVPTLTEAIRCVNSIELLDIIIALLRLCNSPGFTDKKHFGLYDSCWAAMKNMSSTHYDDVKKALAIERDQSSANQKLTCIDLLQRIDEWNQTQIDKGIGFELALTLTED